MGCSSIISLTKQQCYSACKIGETKTDAYYHSKYFVKLWYAKCEVQIVTLTVIDYPNVPYISTITIDVNCKYYNLLTSSMKLFS